MALLTQLLLDIRDPSWVTGNTAVLAVNEPLFLSDGRYAYGDGVTQVQSLSFFGTGSTLTVATIDITGLNTIDMTGITADIINLTSSNGTEIINSISNYSKANGIIQFRPSATLDVTWNDISIGGGNLKLAATPIVILGTKYGFIEVQRRVISGAKFCLIKMIDQYV